MTNSKSVTLDCLIHSNWLGHAASNNCSALNSKPEEDLFLAAQILLTDDRSKYQHSALQVVPAGEP